VKIPNIEIEDFERKVVESAAETLLERYSYDFREKIQSVIERAVTAEVDKRIQDQADEVVSNGLDALRFPRTSVYGEAKDKGDPLTLREFIASRIDPWFEERVDSSGKPICRGHYNYSTTGKPRILHVVGGYIDQELNRATTQALKDLGDRIGDQVGKAARDAIIAKIGGKE
jgi:hypothetical protein